MTYETELLERLTAARDGTLPVSDDEVVEAAADILRIYPSARPTVAEAAEFARARIGDATARELNERNRAEIDGVLARARARLLITVLADQTGVGPRLARSDRPAVAQSRRRGWRDHGHTR